MTIAAVYCVLYVYWIVNHVEQWRRVNGALSSAIVYAPDMRTGCSRERIFSNFVGSTHTYIEQMSTPLESTNF